MKNHEIAEMLEEIADFLEIQEVEYKPRAYRRAARNVESHPEPIEDVHDRGELEEIDGVGESIAEKIAEYLETGEMAYYERLKADLPVDMDALTAVEGVGPKTAKALYDALGVTDLEDLERSAREGEIADVEGFGEATQETILDHVDLARRGQERTLLGRAEPMASAVRSRLVESGAFDRVDVVGSFRRRRPTVGDIDVLATASDPEAGMDALCDQEDVTEVLSRGPTKSSVIVSGGLRVDLRIVADEEYGAGLVYFTGSKEHNIALRRRAIDRGLKLNEYGLFDVSDVAEPDDGQRVGELVAAETEQAVYDALELAWIPPELRENTGELEAAASGDLPDLVETGEIRGDLQAHTTYSDGSSSVREIAEAADARGLEYVAVTDHGPNAPIPGVLDGAAFEAQREDVRAVNDDDALAVTVLQGVEAEITADGVDLPDGWVEACDVVVGGMHTGPSNPTDHAVAAIESGDVDVLAHPTNRLINEREPLDLDLDRVVAAAAGAGVAIEINAQPERLDLDWEQVKAYRDEVPFVVSTDAHAVGEFDHLHLGVAQARRGWCEAGDVLNTRPLGDLRSVFE